jgi:Fic family protein
LYEVDRGFTFSVAFETAAWELKLAEKGEQVRSLFAAQMQAYDYVLDLATKSEPITEAAIRKLHEVVCGAQETYRVITAIGFQEQALPKGRYKVLPNHVVHTRDGATHSYAPVDVTPVEMARLMSEIRSDAFQKAHPVMQAAYAHYGLVVVHPFADGNGRVARALASAFTYRAISMPIMILSEHKGAYLDALEDTDSGNCQSFVDFMMVRSLDTISLVDESLRSTQPPKSVESLAAIDELYLSSGGYTREQVDEIGRQFVITVDKELSALVKKTNSARVRGLAHLNEGTLIFTARPDPSKDAGGRYVEGGRHIKLEFHSAPPLNASVHRQYDLFLPKNAHAEDDVRLVQLDGEDQFTARIDEIASAGSGVLHIRASIFAERVIAELLAELRSKAERLHPRS